MKEINKLVRDGIPQIIEADGRIASYRLLNPNHFADAAFDKLVEEVDEFHENKNMEELADILEVIETIANLFGKSFDEVLKIKAEKRAERGGFTQGVYLESVTNPKALKVKLSDVGDLFIQQNMELFINIHTGEAKWKDDEYGDYEDSDEYSNEFYNDDHIRIDPPDSRSNFRIMEDFIEVMVSDNRIAKDLNYALSGRGPFRAFKDKLYNYPVIQKQWYEYEKKRQIEYLEQYFKCKGLEVEFV